MADYTAGPIKLTAQSEFTVEKEIKGPHVNMSGSSNMEIAFSIPKLVGTGNFTVEGIRVIESKDGSFHRVSKYVGERNVPHDIVNLRRYVYELCRRMGTPVIWKHMLNYEDTFEGTVTTSENFDDIYEQTRNRDPMSHGIGFVSTELSEDEFVTPSGGIVTNIKNTKGYPHAPKYRGYGPGFLIWIIEPDAAVDYFKVAPQGVIQKVQTATAIAPWYPDINDNDLLIHVELDRHGLITGTAERYQAKMSSPISLRGSNENTHGGMREYSGDLGTRHVVNTTFQMVLLPRNHELQNVEVDR